MTLRSKTILGIALIEAIALGVLIVSGLNWLKSSNEKSLEIGSQQLVSVFAKASRDAVIATDLAYLDSFAQSVVTEHNLAYIRISDQRGTELTRQGDYININTDVSPFEAEDGIYDVASEITLGERSFGRVEMGVRIDGLQQTVQYATRASVVIATIEMSLAAIFSFALGSYLLRRLESLRKGVVEITQKGPGTQISVTGNDEVTRVGHAFNDMSASLLNAQSELTKQFEAQRLLSEKVSLLAEVAEHARDVIIITDEKGKIVWVNRAFELLTEYTLDEVRGKIPGELLQGDETDQAVVEKLSQSIKDKTPVRVEIQNYTKSQRSYWVELELSPVLNDYGEVLRFIAVERDISERRAMEAQLSTAVQESKRAAQAKSEFLANMSHEIRTPMNAIMGMSELLLEKETRSEEKKLLTLLHQSSTNLVTIINDILDYSKAAAGKLTLTNESFDLHELVENCISLCSYQANQKKLILLADIPLSIPSQVIGDKGRINQILLNLVGNAIKFTEHGHISVSVRYLAGAYRFSVMDTGIGIPDERLPSIMEKFEQVDNSITRKYEGTGLGLAIAKQLIQLYGGELVVTSKEGVGSTFTFSLNLAISSAQKKKLSKLNRVNVLLIDDYTPRAEHIKSIAQDIQLPLIHKTTAELSSIASLKQWGLNVVMLGSTGINADELRLLLPQATLAFLLPNMVNWPVANARALEQPITHSSLLDLLNSTQPQQQQPVSCEKAEPDFSSINLLIAEDSSINRILITKMLEKTNINLTLAEDGAVAVEMYKQLKPDMVITDISMPNKDGFTVAKDIRELQASFGYPWCPVVAFSAHALQEQRDKSHEVGMNDYLTKPVQKAELLDMIAKWTLEYVETT
ncbi:ATP-binding protein [Vibrio sp. CAU 1672]|uniref:ATP-binding protein n=1 Tax=Vibrio sp. CAU 1672 TaxID=3032594 RepID=UPI0023DA9E56|nr:ATP-binding protein [Vibrio sp. CAU 1672]MDF2152867.1 ATP-binding protein [Vibrio sp. CAU 1672]